jgi:hypothetical protein
MSPVGRTPPPPQIAIEPRAPSADEQIDILKRRADVVRSRLLRAVDALDARRHQVKWIGAHATSLAVPALLSVAGVLTLFGASAAFFVLGTRARRRRSLGYRASLALQKLDFVGRPSLARRVLERVTLSIAGIAATQIAKLVTQNVVDGRRPDGRLAVGAALRAHHERLGAGGGGLR